MFEAEEIELANEYRRLQRQLEARTQQLNALLAASGEVGEFPTDFLGARNRRYSIEFIFEALESESSPYDQGPPQERSVIIDNGTIFRCAYIESFLRAVGTAADPFTGDDVTMVATLPWNIRLTSFDYLWNVRDTGTDREWCNVPQPSLFGGGGYMGPLWLPRRTALSGGTALYAQISPFRNTQPESSDDFFEGGTVSQYVLQMSFVGHEVPDTTQL